MVKRSQAEGVEKNIRLDGAHRACGDAEAARAVLQGIADGPSGTPAPLSAETPLAAVTRSLRTIPANCSQTASCPAVAS